MTLTTTRHTTTIRLRIEYTDDRVKVAMCSSRFEICQNFVATSKQIVWYQRSSSSSSFRRSVHGNNLVLVPLISRAYIRKSQLRGTRVVHSSTPWPFPNHALLSNSETPTVLLSYGQVDSLPPKTHTADISSAISRFSLHRM